MRIHARSLSLLVFGITLGVSAQAAPPDYTIQEIDLISGTDPFL